MPLLLLLLFGYALSLDVDRIPTLIYDLRPHGDEPAARSRSSKARGISTFGASWTTYKAIEQGIDKGKILMGIAIPVDFSDKLGSGQEVVRTDPARRQRLKHRVYRQGVRRIGAAGLFASRCATEAQNRRGGMRLVSPIDPRVRVWYNSSISSRATTSCRGSSR